MEVGDRSLRSDIELLAAYGIIDGPITTWPISQAQFARLSDNSSMAEQPANVQLAARRVMDALAHGRASSGWHAEAALRTTETPNVVRDFGDSARNQADEAVGISWGGSTVDAAIRIGDQSRFDGSQTSLALDGSYVSALLGDWQVYAGWVEKWYGPGWTSSLTLSNNARPFPKIGIARNGTQPFESPWLHWLGPWHVDTFVGLLDGPRIIHNTALAGLRITLEPVHQLEVGLTRTTEWCGSEMKCDPISAAFHVDNSTNNANSSNDEATFDAKYSRTFGTVVVSPYVQLMNEDTGPIVHSCTSYLGGSSLTGPLGTNGAQWRMTMEYTDTVARLNMFDLGKKSYGCAYNNYQYVDGMRYRDRTLGFSLDSDSRLFSFVDLITDSAGRSYRVAYYRADINDAALASPPGGYAIGAPQNVVSAQPVLINEIEAGIGIPFRGILLDLSVRHEDAQPFPGSGSKTSGELDLSYRF
jgi:hypothetical protein